MKDGYYYVGYTLGVVLGLSLVLIALVPWFLGLALIVVNL